MQTMNKQPRIPALMLGLALAVGGSAAHATATYYEDNSSPVDIPGIATFTTTGAMMDGLEVTAVWSDGTQQTAIWGATGASSGGAFGTDWSLTQSDTTFSNPWTFSNTSGSVLYRLILDGSSNLTLFDRTFNTPDDFSGDCSTTGPEGTPDSAKGRDLCISGDSGIYDYIVTYSMPVGVGGDSPVGDEFKKVTVEFQSSAGGYAANSFMFLQDTDNDSRYTCATCPPPPPPAVPEPSSIALLGLGLLGFAATRRKRN